MLSNNGLPSASLANWRHSLNRGVMGAFETAADWLLDHWLGLMNWSLGIVLLGAIVTPILAWLGIEPLAGWIFRTYHAICDQIPSHALFIFGHQMALCSRNFSLYFGLWFGTMVFRRVRHHVKPLDWRLAILLCLPMAIDGGTQFFGWRESTIPLRIVTGLLFGSGIIWFALPYLQQAMDEVEQQPHALMPPPTLSQSGQPSSAL